MSETTNLKLFKHDNPPTNENQFDVENALNKNWDKIDESYGEIKENILTLQENDTEIKEDIEEIQENISNIQDKNIEQDNKLIDLEQENKNIKSALINVETEQAKSLHIEDASTVSAQLSVEGNAEQEVREGYNLIDIINSSLMGQDKGVTTEISEDGYLIANGTPTSSYIVFIRENITDLLEDGQTYSLWQEKYADEENSEIYLQVIANPVSESGTTQYFSSGKNKKTFTVNKTNYNYSYTIQTGTISLAGVFDNYKNRYMLYKGTDNKNFELYGAMPSPKYPSEIKTVGNDINEFDKNSVEFEDGYYSTSGDFTESALTNHTNNYTEIKENTDYIISGIKRHSGYNYPSIYAVYFYDSLKNWLGRTETFYQSDAASIDKWIEYTFKTPSNCKYLRFQCQKNEVNLDLDTIKLQKGTVATSYSPYRTR